MKDTYNQNGNGAHCAGRVIKSIPIWKSSLKATFLPVISVIIVHVRAGQPGVGRAKAFITSLGSWRADGPACQQPSLVSEGSFRLPAEVIYPPSAPPRLLLHGDGQGDRQSPDGPAGGISCLLGHWDPGFASPGSQAPGSWVGWERRPGVGLTEPQGWVLPHP